MKLRPILFLPPDTDIWKENNPDAEKASNIIERLQEIVDELPNGWKIEFIEEK